MNNRPSSTKDLKVWSLESSCMVLQSQSPIGSVQRPEPPVNQKTPKTTICPELSSS